FGRYNYHRDVMMPFRTAIILLAFLGSTTPLTDKNREVGAKVLGACAAFATDGGSAAATFNDTKISLDVTDPTGKASHLTLPLRYRAQINGPILSTTCDTYFDRVGDLVAIGISSGCGQLQVAVADLKAMKWIGDW